ncbi:MAG: 2-dehydropantoate 2-reductase N-terminal domain-containing protein [Pseudomonadota bacterium]|nr:2-dehydropantoate 2-reductase N-terminal domain-containing protein [Pseudomonadota bacterium]
MRVLIVGAGSVGQVYGWHLQQAGVSVHVYVRPKYAEEARAGFVLYPPGTHRPTRWKPDGVLTSPAEVAAAHEEQPWDQVWLCIASTALRGDWLGEILSAAKGATLVSMLPGLRDRDLLTPLVPPERLVIGLISFSSWHAPLGAEPLPEPGMAWWHPPLSSNLFEGPASAVNPIVAALKKGGCPAAPGAATAMASRGSSFLLTAVAAMECAGWSFAGLRQARWATLAAAAGQEALTISTTHLGIPPGPLKWLVSPAVLRLVTRIAPLVAPMDIEAFLRAHFSKVGDQTLLAFDTWIAEGRTRSLPVTALTTLAAELRQVRGAP